MQMKQIVILLSFLWGYVCQARAAKVPAAMPPSAFAWWQKSRFPPVESAFKGHPPVSANTTSGDGSIVTPAVML